MTTGLVQCLIFAASVELSAATRDPAPWMYMVASCAALGLGASFTPGIAASTLKMYEYYYYR